ncbi:MAG TPA: helicase-related protein [Xanthobacteraceae bacterium]|jgi:ATP-dependent RNA helicase SUPV3L1/SUV3|nr:helicase-related protein [Xanthobacteraceae bacterium]
MPISFSPPADRNLRARGAGVTAVLGPTNTGKTHLAIERMLAHSSGIIGLPLRLLAREVYNKAVDRVGAESVALITGEEKIKPPNPRFWVATVEAMPRDLDVAFVAVDEIQLAADFERGHVFTDRMLNRRGREETLVLGAATMKPIVERLLPGASIVSRPRLSQLTFSGDKKLTRLPRRSAIVAFSADEVYAIAELIRRQRGGAAVVLGSLSPRTRNAQVDLYQSGQVDYLVATDAIGMGLNLDVDHIAFASDRKFDGYQFRKLSPSEMAQIAGRAGRATRDGTFGTSGRCPPFETELVQALETHSFEPVRTVQWRNSDLDFSSVGALQATLATPPTEAALTRAPVAEDILVLDHAARDDEVRNMIGTSAHVERLWDVCQLPDYRKIAPANHAELVVTVFGYLQREGRIADDWFAQQVTQADRTDGDIDTLSTRIAHIRTWTFAANRPDWLADPEHWQGVTRGVEDRLSDALHERLTERFVDRRTSVLMRRLRENTGLEPEFNKRGEVVVEGHVIGRLDGFTFVPDASSDGSEAKALQNAAQKALAGEVALRATRLAEASDDHFVLASDGTLRWIGAAVGKLIAGDEALRPRVRVIADEHLTGAPRDAVQERLDRFIKSHIGKFLGPLSELGAAEDITGIARGVAFQLIEALGVLDRQRVAEEVKGLDQPSRATLRKYGVRFGAYHLYLPALLKPAPRKLAVQLWALKFAASNEMPEGKSLDDLLHLAGSGRTSIPIDRQIDPGLYRTAGYRVCGERAVRVDILERLADLIRPALMWRESSPGAKPAAAFPGGGFTVVNTMTSLTGASGEDFASILRSLGYRMEQRPKPPEPPPAPAPAADAALPEATTTESVATESAASETAGTETTAPEATATSDATEAADITAPAEAAPLTEDVSLSASEDASGSDEQITVEVEAPSVSETDVAPKHETATSEAAVVETAPVEAAAEPAQPATPEEPILVEVWRPGRVEGRRPRPERREGDHARRRGRGRDRQAPAPQPDAAVAASAPPGEAAGVPGGEPSADTDSPNKESRHRRHRHRRGGERHGGESHGSESPAGERPGNERRANERRGGERHGNERSGNERSGGEHRADRSQRERPQNRPPRFERREKVADPNSPFAKLAALKAQLEANAKERG